MGIVTTYICDVSGKQGGADEFVDVTISSKRTAGYSFAHTIKKFVHKDVALKLGILPALGKEVEPEQVPTFESQLSTLLKDYIADLVYDEVVDQMNK